MTSLKLYLDTWAYIHIIVNINPKMLFLDIYVVAIKRDCINKYQLEFEEAFGPGTANPMGEDSIYLRDLLKRSNNVFTSIDLLATIEQEISTWFKGYDRNYFINLGKATKRIYPRTFIYRVFKNVIYYTLKGLIHSKYSGG